MFNTAFCPKSNHLAESMHGKTISWMKEISKTKNCAIAGTLMIKEGKIFSIALFGFQKMDNLHLR